MCTCTDHLHSTSIKIRICSPTPTQMAFQILHRVLLSQAEKIRVLGLLCHVSFNIRIAKLHVASFDFNVYRCLVLCLLQFFVPRYVCQDTIEIEFVISGSLPHVSKISSVKE